MVNPKKAAPKKAAPKKAAPKKAAPKKAAPKKVAPKKAAPKKAAPKKAAPKKAAPKKAAPKKAAPKKAAPKKAAPKKVAPKKAAPKKKAQAPTKKAAPKKAATKKAVYYYKEKGFSKKLIEVILSFVKKYSHYAAASKGRCDFDAESTRKLKDLGFDVGAVGKVATDPVATKDVAGVSHLANPEGCSCLGSLYTLWSWVKDRNPNLTNAQAVDKVMDMFDGTIAPGTFFKASNASWEEAIRPKGRKPIDDKGKIAKIVKELKQAGLPCEVGKRKQVGKKLVWNDGNYDGGAIGIVVSNSSSAKNKDTATAMYAILLKPGYDKIVVVMISREHCRNMVEVNKDRAELAIDCIRDAYKAGKGVSNVFFLLATVILLTLPYFAH